MSKRLIRKPAPALPVDAITVTAEQRRHLVEDAAYFRAEQFRPVVPGRYRKQDRCAAEAEIEAVLKKHKPC